MTEQGKILKLRKTDSSDTPDTTAVDTTNNPYFSVPPSEADGTDAYTMTQVQHTHVAIKSVPNIATGGRRNKKWGAVVSIGIVPDLDKTDTGPVILPTMPSQFFDAESVEALKARIVWELEKAIDLAVLQVKDPAAFKKCQEDFVSSLGLDPENLGGR